MKNCSYENLTIPVIAFIAGLATGLFIRFSPLIISAVIFLILLYRCERYR